MGGALYRMGLVTRNRNRAPNLNLIFSWKCRVVDGGGAVVPWNFQEEGWGNWRSSLRPEGRTAEPETAVFERRVFPSGTKGTTYRGSTPKADKYLPWKLFRQGTAELQKNPNLILRASVPL